MPDAVLDRLRAHAAAHRPRAYVPYSTTPEAAMLLLSDGTWVPGVRVENAAYPLSVPPLLAAYYTARCAGRTDLVAAVQTGPIPPDAAAVLAVALGMSFSLFAPDALVADGAALPTPADRLYPFLDADVPDDAAGVALAERVARRAWVPESGFPVGCVLQADDGRLVPGCNVEHADWTRGLCAERVALVTARAYGITTYRRLWLACPKAPGGSPCGACRQALVEWAPAVPIVIGHGADAPDVTSPELLLPDAFNASSLRF